MHSAAEEAEADVEVDPRMSEGIGVLRECARGAELALRARCPMVLLQAATMLTNVHLVLLHIYIYIYIYI